VSDSEPTQYTPKGHEIPVPKRDDIMRIIDKSAQPLPDEKAKRKRRKKK
jgi:hypothetical protein